EFSFGFLVIYFYITKGIIMTSYYFITFNKVAGKNSIFNAHCKIITYWKYGQVKIGTHWYKLHVHCKGGVAGYVDVLMLTFYHKTSRLPSITAVWKRTGMNGIYIF